MGFEVRGAWPRGCRRFVSLVAVSLLVMAGAGRSEAGSPSPNTEAHAAYERGAAAFDRGDYPTAAKELARADALFPNVVALTTAIKAAILADDPALAMELADRTESRPVEATLSAVTQSAR